MIRYPDKPVWKTCQNEKCKGEYLPSVTSHSKYCGNCANNMPKERKRVD